jgi:prepilin-type N-terminal cleavage/methylation domain-containing protein
MKCLVFKKHKGFTLIELLVVISIIGFLTATAVFSFNIVRMNSRDALRVGNANTINKALSMFVNDNGYYPSSNGECLSTSGTGGFLIADEVIVNIPTDPLWPTDSPSAFNGGATHDYAVNPSSEFCYWYYGSSDGTNYYLSYYLESNSKSGNAGINVMSPSGIQ